MGKVLRNPLTGEIVFTETCDGYEDWEQLSEGERPPSPGEYWTDSGWTKPSDLELNKNREQMNQLPPAARSLLFEYAARIYMLEQRLKENK